MVKVEFYRTREDGVELTRTYSDKNMMIERDGVRYNEAIDPAYLNRKYTETDELVEQTPEDEAMLREKAAAYDILMGGGTV